MGWTSQEEFDDARQAAARLTPEQRANLTWERAQEFVVMDTLEIARWQGLKASGCTPWEAVARLKGLDQDG